MLISILALALGFGLAVKNLDCRSRNEGVCFVVGILIIVVTIVNIVLGGEL